MRYVKTSLCVCMQNFRKWRTDYRIWTAGILLFMLTFEQTHDLSVLAQKLGVKTSLWYYPFLFSQYHMKLIFIMPILLVFCSAPFVDDNAMFVIVRSKRKAWITGQVLYIAAASAVYNLFILIFSILTLLPSGEMQLGWGKLLNTMSVSDAAMSAGFPFLESSRFVLTHFTPLQAVWFTFLLSFLVSFMLGMLVYALNCITNTKSVGTACASIIIIFSCYTEVFGTAKLLAFSPVSWCTLDKIDVAGKTVNPSFTYAVSVMLAFIAVSTVVLLLFSHRWTLDKKHI